MKKNLSLFLLLVLVPCLFFLFNCGSKFASSKTTVTFYNAESLPEQIKMIKEIIAGFEKENPDIKIEHISGDGLKKLQTMFASDTAPDVFMWWTDPSRLVGKDQLVPLNEYIAKYNVDMNVYWKCLTDLYTYDGNIYAMPLQLKTCAVVYNKELFDREGMAYPKAGWTWQNFYDLGLHFKKDSNNDRIIDQFGTMFGSPIMMLYMNGATLANDKEKTSRLDKENNVVSILEFLDKIQQDTGASMAESVNLTGGAGTSGFMTGKVAMLVAPAWMVTMLNTTKDFEWGVVPVPIGLDGKRHDVFEGACLAMHKSSKNKDAAFRFMNYYCGEKGMKIFTKYKNGIPAYKKFAYEEYIASPNEKLKPFLDAGENANVYLGFKYIMSGEVFVAFFQEWDLVYLKKKTVQQAVRDMAKKIDQLLITERNN